MSSKFYMSIIEEEKSAFNIKDDKLKKAATDVIKTYSSKALQEGSAFLDYNVPANRCAYLFKYAAGHTGIIAKYFHQVTKKEEIKTILNFKTHIRICCLGGGPGVDIVGMFKAMAITPALHTKVVQVTVLDICGGWRNSFKHVISRLKHGKVKGVPASFIDSNNFQANLISVDLLKPLPENVKKALSNADIISMVKFVSAVIGIQRSTDALKEIANMTKVGAIVFFMDNLSKKVSTPLSFIAEECGLETVVGPLHEVYKQSPQTLIKPKDTAYECQPLNATRISVIAWIKASENIVNSSDSNVLVPITVVNEECDWDTDSDSMDSNEQQTKIVDNNFQNFKQLSSRHLDKFTQTDELRVTNSELEELPDLLCAISDLIKAVKHYALVKNKKSCSGCCH